MRASAFNRNCPRLRTSASAHGAPEPSDPDRSDADSGDGIGPEIVAAVRSVLDALGSPFRWDERAAGMAAVEKFADPLPPETLESIRRTKLALKGPLTTPVGGGFRSVNVRLREEFELYANVRPVRTLVPGQRYDHIDLVLIRENLEGLYVGFEHYVPIGDDPHAVAIGSGINTRAGARRIIRYAFEYAVRHGRKKVTVVHKANVLKALTGLFLETGLELAKEYAGRIDVDQRIVDACAMQLVIEPVAVRCHRHNESIWRHPVGFIGRAGRRTGDRPRRQHRRARRNF